MNDKLAGPTNYNGPPPDISEDDAANTRYHSRHRHEYLRQTTMCGVSLAIDQRPAGYPTELREDRWGNQLGWGTRRECINWDGLTTWQGEQLQKWEQTQ
ncbi:MAG: hypothetical protein LQ340_000936 [Diploschistes diacapsis]|nr:MAG: hypothetical protein LQ340_000936 [Diploschistes diacapsis]